MAVLYKELAIRMKDQSNKEILLKLASDELDHYHTIKRITTRNIKPDRLRINLFFLICNIFGLTFGIKLMEYNKKRDRRLYASLNRYPQIKVIIEEGEINEKILIGKIEEQRLMYMSAVVLGLNDAIIEFTGALAGFAFAFQNSKYVAMAGAITGIAAALSMGASEYLSSKSDKNITTKSALISASYTLVTYFVTVIALLSPFVYLSNVYWGISICLLSGSVVVAIFNFYYAVVRGESFLKRFGEMIIISFSVAFVSFIIGLLLKHFTGINI